MSAEGFRGTFQHVLADKFNQLLSEMAFNLVMTGGVQRSSRGIGRVDIEGAVGLLLDMKGELHLARAGREFQTWEIHAEASKNGGLDLLLQFVAGRSFERRDVRIRGARDESAFRFRFDPVYVFCS